MCNVRNSGLIPDSVCKIVKVLSLLLQQNSYYTKFLVLCNNWSYFVRPCDNFGISEVHFLVPCLHYSTYYRRSNHLAADHSPEN